MLKSALRHLLPLILVITIAFTFVGFALAHESEDLTHVHTDAEADATISADPMKKPVRPLEMVRQKAAEIKQNATGAKVDLRAETRIQMENASSGPEKRAVMKGAVDARIDIAKQRQASTSNLKNRVKGALKQHTGLIKERFALAMRQFDQLIGRIETRISKLKAEGAATAAVDADLALAKTANAEAKADIQAVADFTAGVDESMDRAQVRAQLQTLTKEAQASVQAAHKALQKVVRSLVGLAKETKKPAPSASVEAEAVAETTTE